jgi:hypothetical protein
LGDLKIGDAISVESENDIKTVTKFEATKINIYPAPGTSVVPQ